MSRRLRIHVALGFGIVFIGIAIGVIGMSQSFAVPGALGEAEAVHTIAKSIAHVQKWQRIGFNVSLAGVIYAMGILTIWFIGPPEKAASSQVPSEN